MVEILTPLRSLLLSIPIGCDMRKYYEQVHQRAAETGQPVSELLFEDYCKRVGIQWENIQVGTKQTPDYKLVLDDQTIIAEVKEFEKNKDEQESYRLMEDRRYGKVLNEEPGDRVRKKIRKSSPQIKALTAGRHPGMLVLFDDGQIAGHLAPYHIMTAMYGLELVEMAVPRDISIKPYIADRRFGPKKKMTEGTNTSISAIGALVVTGPDRKLKLHVYHNKFAAVPIDPKLLTSRGILQYRIDIENRTWVECKVRSLSETMHAGG